MTEKRKCPVCLGRKKCGMCGGSGQIGGRECQICDGTGKCPRCKGKGVRSLFNFQK